MSVRYGDIVQVRGQKYRVVSIDNLSDLGTKFFGQFRYTLERVSDKTRWRYSGTGIYHNCILSPAPGSALHDLYGIMEELDREDDDNVRADLIDAAIGLADSDPEAAEAWKVYR